MINRNTYWSNLLLLGMTCSVVSDQRFNWQFSVIELEGSSSMIPPFGAELILFLNSSCMDFCTLSDHIGKVVASHAVGCKILAVAELH